MSIKKLWLFLILLMSILLIISGCDGLFGDSDDDDDTTHDPIDAGQLIVGVSNFGIIGDPECQQPSLQYPDEDGFYHLFEGRTWVAAVVGDEHRVSKSVFYEYEFTPVDESGNQIEKEYTVLGNGVNECTYHYSDTYPVEDHTPIGITITEETSIDPSYPNILRLHQVIRNESGATLDSFYVAWIADFDVSISDDIVSYLDDWCSFDSGRQLAYMWDGDNTENSGDDTGDNGLSPYYAGIALIDSPAPLAAYQWWNWVEDPLTDDQKFQFIAGIHPASNGEAFRADPDEVFDYRVLLSVGPMSVEAGGEVEVDMIYVIGEGLEGIQQAVDNYSD